MAIAYKKVNRRATFRLEPRLRMHVCPHTTPQSVRVVRVVAGSFRLSPIRKRILFLSLLFASKKIDLILSPSYKTTRNYPHYPHMVQQVSLPFPESRRSSVLWRWSRHLWGGSSEFRGNNGLVSSLSWRKDGFSVGVSLECFRKRSMG